jgi:hypothetical protein
VTWAQLRNVIGTGSDGGVFLDGPQGLKIAGDDGIVDTADDGVIETITYPGRDLLIGTADDLTASLADFSREIEIRDINADLRSVTVTLKYHAGAAIRSYTLTAYISNYA